MTFEASETKYALPFAPKAQDCSLTQVLFLSSSAVCQDCPAVQR